VQEVRWDKGAQEEQGIIILSMEKEMEIINCKEDFFVHHRTVSAFK